MEIGELFAELFDLRFGLEMLEGAANGCVGETDGDGLEGAGVKLWVSLHDIEGALRREGVVMIVDTENDLAFLRIGIGGDGKVRAFGGHMDRLGSWCMGERNGRWIDEGDGGGSKLCADGVLRGDGWEVVDGGVGFGGRGHVVVVWRYCRR